MKIIGTIAKRAVASGQEVERGQVIRTAKGKALIETSRGRIWARSVTVLTRGTWVTFVRIDKEHQVLSVARAPETVTKTVRV